MKYICIIKGKIVYMECLIQSSMFYSLYFLLSILLSNVGSALVLSRISATAIIYGNWHLFVQKLQ